MKVRQYSFVIALILGTFTRTFAVPEDAEETFEKVVIADEANSVNDTAVNATETEAKGPKTSPKKMTCLPLQGLNETVSIIQIQAF